MKTATRNKLIEAWNYCDENDKSTEYALQYMQDYASVSLDFAVQFIKRTKPRQRKRRK